MLNENTSSQSCLITLMWFTLLYQEFLLC